MNYTDIDKKYQIVLRKDGYEVLKDNFLQYTTKIETPFTVWNDIASGKTTGTEAMMNKQYRVDGDFDLMLHWDDYFGSGKPKKNTQKTVTEQKKTNMIILLLPWIAFWVGAAIDSYIGSLICNVHQLGSISLIFPITKPKVLKIAPLNISRIRVC